MASVKSVFILSAFLLCMKLSIARKSTYLKETSSTTAGYNLTAAAHTSQNNSSLVTVNGDDNDSDSDDKTQGNGDRLSECRHCPVCGACLDDHDLGFDKIHSDEGNGDIGLSGCQLRCPFCGACLDNYAHELWGAKQVWPLPSALNESVNGGKKIITPNNA